MTLVPDYKTFETEDTPLPQVVSDASGLFWVCKRAFDLFFSTIFLVPATLFVAFWLLLLNPFFNPGPMFYRQTRRGRDCKPFRALKFRTMDVRKRHSRGPNDPVEADRVTGLGRFLRRSRFDELPQVLNVYRGDMSLIGPRPDYYRHARYYMEIIPGYRQRHAVRPGISGFAQIELGYAVGTDATRLKTEADLKYITKAGFALDTQIFLRTIGAVVRMRGH